MNAQVKAANNNHFFYQCFFYVVYYSPIEGVKCGV